ncbi:MAG: Hsp70 family protein [Chlamydiota bacterium]
MVVIGIDLGTSNSVMAYVKDGIPTIIPNAEGKLLTPSIVGFDKANHIYVGEAANVLGLHKTISAFKRKMGTNEVYSVHGHEYTPTMLSSFILRKLKNDAEKFLGEVINEAVITVPAFFTDIARQETRNAAEIAGLKTLRIINEPTAATLAFGFEKKEGEFVMVCDLGGGTFDVSILEFANDIYEVRSTNGNIQLGGNDWTAALYNKKIFGKLLKTPDLGNSILFKQLELAKIKLTTKKSVTVAKKITISRVKFETVTRHLCDQMILCIQQSLKDAEIQPKALDKIILVGGATRMPMIRKLIVDLTEKQPFVDIDPDLVVAKGASIQGGILNKSLKHTLLVDVIPLSLGIETQGGILTKLIPRNSKIPISKNQIFTTAFDNQTEVDIHILQGERGQVKHNISLGKFTLTEIPAAPKGFAKIDVTFSIDINGILHVKAKDIYSENEQTIVVQSNRLSDSDIAKLIQEAKQLYNVDQNDQEKINSQIKLSNIISAVEQTLKKRKIRNNDDTYLKLTSLLKKAKKMIHANKITTEDLKTISKKIQQLMAYGSYNVKSSG